MQKHSKVEDAAIKLVRDLEMQIKALHTSYLVSLNFAFVLHTQQNNEIRAQNKYEKRKAGLLYDRQTKVINLTDVHWI